MCSAIVPYLARPDTVFSQTVTTGQTSPTFFPLLQSEATGLSTHIFNIHTTTDHKNDPIYYYSLSPTNCNTTDSKCYLQILHEQNKV